MELFFKRTKIRIIHGDITELNIDVIVNAANSSLMGGGGVDGAIHRKGGLEILQECMIIRSTTYPDGLPIGKAVITQGGNLLAKYVIHTVGPIWRGGDQGEERLLSEAYRNSLRLAVSRNLKTIAFPSISTGAYGFPIDRAAEIALNAVKGFLETADSLEAVIHVNFTQNDFIIYQEKSSEIFETKH